MERNRNRPVRIAGASGSASDRRHAFAALANNYLSDPVDVIIGDWLSEANMTSAALKKSLSTSSSSSTPAMPAYEPSFLSALVPALPNIAKHNIRVAVNAGASDPHALYVQVLKLIKSANLESKLKVAWIEGDDVLAVVRSSLSSRGGKDTEDFSNLCTSESLHDWAFKSQIIGAQAYLGGLGIAKAFELGAQIVIAGRVSDASPVIGAAVWWHGWDRERDLKGLANAFVAGHLIECSTYVCGGNWVGFKDLETGTAGQEKGYLNIGFPIAEIARNGEVVITKQKSTNGVVSVDTCKAQLLYEIQGPWYFNSDVTAILTDIQFEQLSANRVAVRGVKADLPPPTTKIGITAMGGWQAEVHWFLTGLDIVEKARMLEVQVRDALAEKWRNKNGTGDGLERFSRLEFTINGSVQEDAETQNAATVDFRIFAQARKEDDIATDKFLKPVLDLIMCCYPGGTFHLDFRQGVPKPVMEYWVTLLDQQEVQHAVNFEGRRYMVEGPRRTKTYSRDQPSCDASDAGGVEGFGETVRGPLGWVVGARSGDKGSNSNVGFWVRHADEYAWLRGLLSTEFMKKLLAEEYNGKKIDRFELPNILAVHFLLHDHLDRGVSCSSTYDFLGKNVAEFLRSRHVDIPKRFLNRGKL